VTQDQSNALKHALVRTEVREAIADIFTRLIDDELYDLRETPDVARDCALRIQGIDKVRDRLLMYMENNG
jgi:hypothetical protein